MLSRYEISSWALLSDSKMLSQKGDFTVKMWEKGKTLLETGYVPLLHLLPQTFRRKHLPPYHPL